MNKRKVLFITIGIIIVCVFVPIGVYGAGEHDTKDNDEVSKTDTKLLLEAIAIYDIHIIRLYLKAGVEVNGTNEKGSTPLMFAVKQGSLDIVATLLEYGANTNKCNNENYCPLSMVAATSENNYEMVKLLLEHGANPNLDMKITPLVYLMYYEQSSDDRQKIVTLLLEYGANPNIISRDIMINPLFGAIYQGYEEIATLLLEYGANPNIISASDSIGDGTLIHFTPLMRATQIEDEDIVTLLLKFDADVNKITESRVLSEEKKLFKMKSTALRIAVSLQNYNISKILIDAGANVNERLENGWTPLLSAIVEEEGINLDLIRLLLEHGSDVNVMTKDRNISPLLRATAIGDNAVLRILLEYGADINKRFKYNTTALYLTTSFGHVETVRLLLEQGADASIKVRNGKNNTALKLAESKGYTEIADLIRSYGYTK